MLVSWLQKLSLIDYPWKVACVVFTLWCNLRCSYCHNSEFVLPEKIALIKNAREQEKNFFEFLERRVGILDGVSICGGEPTIHKDLPQFIKRIKEMWFQVKLDTNGTNPEVIKYLLWEWLLDYVAMDIKHIWEWYESLTGAYIDSSIYKESIRIIQELAPDYEFRTTIIKWIHSYDIMEQIIQYIKWAKNYYIQNFRKNRTLDPDFIWDVYNEDELRYIQKNLQIYVKNLHIRL